MLKEVTKLPTPRRKLQMPWLLQSKTRNHDGNSGCSQQRRRASSRQPRNGIILVDLLLVESSPPRYFTLLVGSCLVVVHHGRDRRSANGRQAVIPLPRARYWTRLASLLYLAMTVNTCPGAWIIFLISLPHN